MNSYYDLSSMEYKGHPLRKKVAQGKLVLINPLDIPDKETKLAKLAPDEREFVIKLLEETVTDNIARNNTTLKWQQSSSDTYAQQPHQYSRSYQDFYLQLAEKLTG